VEYQKRSAWVLHKVAKKLEKLKKYKPTVLGDKSWKESEEKFKNQLQSFFADLKLSEIKKWDQYIRNVPEHFQVTQPDFYGNTEANL